MPLTKGPSKQAFEKNLKTEMAAGKPQKQSLAIAYSIQRRAKQRAATHEHTAECAHGCAMADGGMVLDHSPEQLDSDTQEARRRLGATGTTPVAHPAAVEVSQEEHSPRLKDIIARAKNPKAFADGGMVEEVMAERAARKLPAMETGPEQEDAMAEEADFSAYHHIPDPEHDDIPAGIDDEVVGRNVDEPEDMVSQILRDRRARRRE